MRSSAVFSATLQAKPSRDEWTAQADVRRSRQTANASNCVCCPRFPRLHSRGRKNVVAVEVFLPSGKSSSAFTLKAGSGDSRHKSWSPSRLLCLALLYSSSFFPFTSAVISTSSSFPFPPFPSPLVALVLWLSGTSGRTRLRITYLLQNLVSPHAYSGTACSNFRSFCCTWWQCDCPYLDLSTLQQ